MNKTNLTVATKADVSKLIKPKFGPGMLLRAEDLDLLKNYTRDLSRLMFRSLFGCGVVCGLIVKVYEDCGMVIVEVGSGLAIACSGDPIYIPKDAKFPLHEDCHEATVDEEVWVILCSKEKCCGPRTSICASDEDDSPTECTREKDWYEIRVVTSPPECVCSCLEKSDDEVSNTAQGRTQSTGAETSLSEQSVASGEADETDCKCATGPCYEDHYFGICKCHCGDCSDCDCKCVLLAHSKRVGDTDDWTTDHSVRRFIRPVLMRDPGPEHDRTASGGDPVIATSMSILADEIPENQMKRLRDTLKVLSTPERALVAQIVGSVDEPNAKARMLFETVSKYHEDKFAPNIPRERRNLTTRLKADLVAARKRKLSAAKSRKR